LRQGRGKEMIRECGEGKAEKDRYAKSEDTYTAADTEIK
jgi:hypothetical protein